MTKDEKVELALGFSKVLAVAFAIFYVVGLFFATVTLRDRVEATCPAGETVQFDRFQWERVGIWFLERKYFTCQPTPQPTNCDTWNVRCEPYTP